MQSFYVHLFNGFLLSVLLIVALKPMAAEFRLVDMPDARKRHNGGIPLCGGLALSGAYIFSGLAFDAGHRLPWNWTAGFLLLLVIGVADDRWRLPPLPRLTVQAIAAAVLSAGGGAALLILGGAPHELWSLPVPFATAFSMLFIVGTANAVNMLDGADGLAGATVAASLFWLALVAAHVGDGMVAVQAPMLMAAVLGFLVFNLRHPWRASASVFMGDAGSMILGGALATFILDLSSDGHRVPFVALLWIVIVPISDTLSLIVRRAAVGRNPLSSDRWHLHHLLLDCGVAPAAVAPIIAGVSALFGAVAYAAIVFGVPDRYLALGLVVPFLAHTIFVVAAHGHLRSALTVSGGGRPFSAKTLTAPTNEVAG